MLKKLASIGVLILLYLLMINLLPEENYLYVDKVVSPTEIILQNGSVYKINEYTTFDNFFSDKNKQITEQLDITENEAFVMGSLAQYFAENMLEGREVLVHKNDLIFLNNRYRFKLENTGFCIKNNAPINKKAFQKQLHFIRNSNFMIYDLDKEIYFPISKEFQAKNYVVVKQGNKRKSYTPFKDSNFKNIKKVSEVFNLGDVKIIVSDFTNNLKPNRECSDQICKEILYNINQAKQSIDIAIYGYSSTLPIEKALKNAQLRGVKIRLVYDEDKNGNNIYPDTMLLANLIKEKVSDKNSSTSGAIMHNKFYIFDNKTVITGSANLSHTDMSGFNTNNIIVIHSPEAATIYKNEFEQMYSGKFHSDKICFPSKKYKYMEFYFSPQDKVIQKALIPIINNAEKYIYIPTFVITEKQIVQALINAKQRGVDIKIILDALSASNKNSKHKELRQAGIMLKTENYAGKMHSKSIIIDDKFLVLGSMNLSYSGENKNDENIVIIKNPAVAKFYKEFFLYQWQKIPEKWLKFSAQPEGKDSIGSCFDGVDNDYDGLIDMEEESCKQLIYK